MIVEDLKADLSEAAQEKLKEIVGQAVEKKLKAEMKKVTRKLTVRFLLAGAAAVGVFLLVKNSDKITDLLSKPTE